MYLPASLQHFLEEESTKKNGARSANLEKKIRRIQRAAAVMEVISRDAIVAANQMEVPNNHWSFWSVCQNCVNNSRSSQ